MWISTHSSLLRFDERSIGTVHLVVKATGVAKVVSVAVPPPEGGGGGPAVDALSTLWKKENKQVRVRYQSEGNKNVNPKRILKSIIGCSKLPYHGFPLYVKQ